MNSSRKRKNKWTEPYMSYFFIWQIFVPGLLRKSWLTTCNCSTRKKESMLSSIRENHSGKVKTYLVLINHDWYLHLCLHAVMWKLNEYSVICILICIYMLVTRGVGDREVIKADDAATNIIEKRFSCVFGLLVFWLLLFSLWLFCISVCQVCVSVHVKK